MGRLSFTRVVALGGTLLALLAFFVPWVTYTKGSYSGAELAGSLGPALAAIKAGGIKGFDIALYLVPVLAAVAIVFALLSLRQGDAEKETRYRVLGASSAIVGLGVALLFLGSAVLGGVPGVQFQPGLIRTDTQVTTALAKSLNAGTFVSVGIGVYLTILGFLASSLAALMSRGNTTRAAWRTQDFVLLAVIAVVFGAIYWAWLAPYLWIGALWAQPGAELFFGLWFTAGLLGGYIIRRPGAAFLAETLTAGAEILIGAPAGPILLITGMMEALGAELVFAIFGYRRWGWASMAIAGMAAALVALPWNWFRLGYFSLDPTLLLALLGIRIGAGAAAGLVAKLLGDRIAATGSLNAYVIGSERVQEV